MGTTHIRYAEKDFISTGLKIYEIDNPNEAAIVFSFIISLRRMRMV